MKMHGGVEVQLHTLTSAQDGSKQSRFTPSTLPPGREPWYTLERRLDAPQSWSEHGSKNKNPCSCQELKCSYPACSLVTILTEPPWIQLHMMTNLNYCWYVDQVYQRG